jgi:hypothetical protein
MPSASLIPSKRSYLPLDDTPSPTARLLRKSTLQARRADDDISKIFPTTKSCFTNSLVAIQALAPMYLLLPHQKITSAN